ncbi:hypothetical protein WMF20_48975 [Sorangium sp. So ce834]|uniref:hypothetical protein n=1 Tax=Sorangium sp. So ce834 TaxID=3133321 RepID=UPI003F632001
MASTVNRARSRVREAVSTALSALGNRVPPERWLAAWLKRLDREDGWLGSGDCRLLAALGERAPFDGFA